jgi:hypothetical protein
MVAILRLAFGSLRMTVAVSMATGRTNQYAWPINAADGLLARFPSTLIVLAEMVWMAILAFFLFVFPVARQKCLEYVVFSVLRAVHKWLHL